MNTAKLFTVNIKMLGIDAMEKKTVMGLKPNRQHMFAWLKCLSTSQEIQPEKFHSSPLG